MYSWLPRQHIQRLFASHLYSGVNSLSNRVQLGDDIHSNIGRISNEGFQMKVNIRQEAWEEIGKGETQGIPCLD